jgi:thiosulfate/3-mercaptopyruvate sulfurtransferase
VLSAWDKFGVNASAFSDDPHSEIGCESCHGGDPTVETKDGAHGDSLVRDPSADIATCGQCHARIASANETSLHTTFHGYETLFETRAGYDFDAHPEIEEEFANECGACHTTCGQCHVSLPNSVQGGLMEGHEFKAVPYTLGKTSFKQVCTACHNSRIEEEFYGLNDMAVPGYRVDAHYYTDYSKCTDCHDADEMHGDGMMYGTRYESASMPGCEDCHATVEYNDANVTFGSSGDNAFHQQHGTGTSGTSLQCQVCHSQEYKNCNACHVGGEANPNSGVTGDPYLAFEIGKNPLAVERPEYDYVVLRHIPISPSTYDHFGEANLANFESLPNWKYASPHNIQRWTSRTDTTGGLDDGNDGCRSCHNGSQSGYTDWFLRQTDVDSIDTLLEGELSVDPKESEANSAYTVDDNIPTPF